MSQANDIHLPLTSEKWIYLGNESQRLRSEYLLNINSLDLSALSSARAWAEESYNIVSSHVYENMTENPTFNDIEDTITHLSEEYLARSLKISEIQIVKGGYRLA